MQTSEGTRKMDDCKIVDMYWERDERAISESDIKYGRMLSSLAYSLTSSHEDAEECVNDTYLDAWNAMPEARPQFLGAFLSKITRRISIDRFRMTHSQKRGGVENLTLELLECIPSGDTPFEDYENGRLKKTLDEFLRRLDREKRAIFIRRYFYSQSVEFISNAMGIGESKVKTTLFRIRRSLQATLEKEELI